MSLSFTPPVIVPKKNFNDIYETLMKKIGGDIEVNKKELPPLEVLKKLHNKFGGDTPLQDYAKTFSYQPDTFGTTSLSAIGTGVIHGLKEGAATMLNLAGKGIHGVEMLKDLVTGDRDDDRGVRFKNLARSILKNVDEEGTPYAVDSPVWYGLSRVGADLLATAPVGGMASLPLRAVGAIEKAALGTNALKRLAESTTNFGTKAGANLYNRAGMYGVSDAARLAAKTEGSVGANIARLLGGAGISNTAVQMGQQDRNPSLLDVGINTGVGAAGAFFPSMLSSAGKTKVGQYVGSKTRNALNAIKSTMGNPPPTATEVATAAQLASDMAAFKGAGGRFLPEKKNSLASKLFKYAGELGDSSYGENIVSDVNQRGAIPELLTKEVGIPASEGLGHRSLTNQETKLVNENDKVWEKITGNIITDKSLRDEIDKIGLGDGLKNKLFASADDYNFLEPSRLKTFIGEGHKLSDELYAHNQGLDASKVKDVVRLVENYAKDILRNPTEKPSEIANVEKSRMLSEINAKYIPDIEKEKNSLENLMNRFTDKENAAIVPLEQREIRNSLNKYVSKLSDVTNIPKNDPMLRPKVNIDNRGAIEEESLLNEFREPLLQAYKETPLVDPVVAANKINEVLKNIDVAENRLEEMRLIREANKNVKRNTPVERVAENINRKNDKIAKDKASLAKLNESISAEVLGTPLPKKKPIKRTKAELAEYKKFKIAKAESEKVKLERRKLDLENKDLISKEKREARAKETSEYREEINSLNKIIKMGNKEVGDLTGKSIPLSEDDVKAIIEKIYKLQSNLVVVEPEMSVGRRSNETKRKESLQKIAELEGSHKERVDKVNNIYSNPLGANVPEPKHAELRAAADVLDNTRKRFAKIYDIRDALTDNDKVNLSKLPDSEVRGGKGTGNIGLLSRLNLTHGRQLKATPKMTGNAIRNLLINISTNPEFQQETLLNILGRFYPDRFTGLTRGVLYNRNKKGGKDK